MNGFYLNALGMICALGNTLDDIRQRLLKQPQSGVCPTRLYGGKEALSLGVVNDLPDLPISDVRFDSRNNKMALGALAQIRDEVDAAIKYYGADRVGVIIGTSTSGIAESEKAIAYQLQHGDFPPAFHYAQQELGSPATLLAQILEVDGPVYVHSSACASGAKALASAARLIQMGICDAVIAGGVDTLSAFVVSGFASLESVSVARTNPLSINRNGINIGEGAALFLMSRESAPVALRGWGETSDGYHVSAPDPEGKGAKKALEIALSHAGIECKELDYINLHGTGTVQNDAMESRVVHDLCGDKTWVSSTKPMTGHTLGAAGAIEAGLCWLTMQDNNVDGLLPPHLWDSLPDPTLPQLRVVREGDCIGRPLRWCLSNSFAFGGANAALVLGRTQ
ncbi:MAG: beta-ketoacyl-[acyl-carrier-protein] synthase family protein [Methylobacillus sp.]|jgi:3-oxoacyl-[acyl-carrier-protein] synthase-1|nr:beta-ketoacyl-[acyl-carrier-protein] synthase family protein [Methylobacillus sp.]